MAITFVLATVITVIVGIIIGSLVTYCIMKRRMSNQHGKPMPDASKGPVYETVSGTKVSKTEIEMGENVAYGPIHH